MTVDTEARGRCTSSRLRPEALKRVTAQLVAAHFAELSAAARAAATGPC